MFSVIIPIHNKLPHLDRAIYSVLNQTFKDFELLLIDDASTDGSSEKMMEYKDPRIRTFKRNKPGPGGYAARNLGIEKAKYEWIAFLDADDEWKNNHLENIYNVLKQNKNIEIISTNWYTSKNGKTNIKEDLKKITKPLFKFTLVDFLYAKSLMWTGAISIKKELLLKAGLFPIGTCRRGGDMDTWIRSLYISNENIFINQYTAIYYRDIEGQVTKKIKTEKEEFCTTKTLNKIKEENQNKKLHKAIDVYNASFIYSKMIIILRESRQIDKSKLNLIDNKFIRAKVLLKIILYKLFLQLNLKN